MIGATIFILLGLVLLVDFAHSWSETCLENWENSSSSNLWQWVLISSTGLMYAFTITLTGLLYGYFAGSGCTLNQFFITFNLIFCVAITIMCVHPLVQEFNPRSGLAQSAMVAAYCTYLIVSAITNHTHESIKSCNPLRDGAGAEGARSAVVLVGGVFTFLAIAYSTTRAATQSRALVGQKKHGGHIQLSEEGPSEMNFVTTQPGRTQTPRYQAMLAAVEAGYVVYNFRSVSRALPFPQVPFQNPLCMKNRRLVMKTVNSKVKNEMMRRLVLVTMCVHFYHFLFSSFTHYLSMFSIRGSTSSLLEVPCMLLCFSRIGMSIEISFIPSSHQSLCFLGMSSPSIPLTTLRTPTKMSTLVDLR